MGKSRPLDVHILDFPTSRRLRGNLKHAEQICAGLDRLHFQGMIRVTYSRRIQPDNKTPFVEIEALGRRIAYDLRDQSWLLETEHWEKIDYCFKRMYNRSFIERHPAFGKIRPLGFNYPVFNDKNHILRRAVPAGSAGALFLGGLRSSRLLGSALKNVYSLYSWRVSNLEQPPRLSREPFIVFAFIVRDPAAWPHLDAAEIRAENETRIGCFRKLKEKFGSRVKGGAMAGPFARRTIPELCWDMSRKVDYLKVLKECSIGISSRGIWGSVPWKFGEYIACSKSIVSESFACEVPGDFAEGRNYLAFETPEACVKQAGRLLEDETLRFSMEKANHDYYMNYLRPDRLVWNTLQTVARENGTAL